MALRGIKQTIAALSLVFAAASGADQTATLEKNPEGLWKLGHLDVVMEVKKCDGGNFCTSFYWINPKAENVFNSFGPRQEMQTRMLATSFQSALSRTKLAAVTEKDIQSLCGYAPKMDLKPTGNDTWEGTMELRGYATTINMKVTQSAPTEATATLSKGIVSHTETWHKIEASDSRYPRCQPPVA